MTNFNEEAIAKAKQAKSVEELLTLAKESGVEMTAEQAQEYYTQLNQKSGELADDELDNVAGGGCGDSTVDGQLIVSARHVCDFFTCRNCGGNKVVAVYGGRLVTNNACKGCGASGACEQCRYAVHFGVLYTCSHPSNKQ